MCFCKPHQWEQGHPRGFYATCFYKLAEAGGYMERLPATVESRDEVVDVTVRAETWIYAAVVISSLKKTPKHLECTFLTANPIFPVFQVQMSVYFLGHTFFIVAFLSVPYLRKMFLPKKERGQLKQD